MRDDPELDNDKMFVNYYVSEVSNGKFDSTSWSDTRNLAFLRRDLITLFIVKKQQEPTRIKNKEVKQPAAITIGITNGMILNCTNSTNVNITRTKT